VEIDPPRSIRIERTIEAARLLRDAGVVVTLNSDDPGMFGSWIAAEDSDPERALVLAGAAAGMQASAGATPPDIWLALSRSFMDRARAALPDDAASAAWERGRALSYPAAIEFALELEMDEQTIG